MYGNKCGNTVYTIPVEWCVTENIEVRANSLEEAVMFILDNDDLIPLGSEPEYIEGTWKISADENGSRHVRDICDNLYEWGYDKRFAEQYDVVEEL